MQAPITFQQDHLHSWLSAKHLFLGEHWDYKIKIPTWSQRQLWSCSHVFRIRLEYALSFLSICSPKEILAECHRFAFGST